MPYNPNPSTSLRHRPEHLADWNRARPGQWFIGVVDTHRLQIYIVPVNVFEGGSGRLNRGTLNNTNIRTINRYASGAPGEREGIMQDFATLNAGNWLANRQIGETHHTSVAHHYGSDPVHCLGFTLIKLAQHFGQVKFGSLSLNVKPGCVIHHSFSRATVSGNRHEPGTPQMPPSWARAVVAYLRGVPFLVQHIAASNE